MCRGFRMTEYEGLCSCGVSYCRMPLQVIVVGFCLAFACWVLELMHGASVVCDEVSQFHGRPCRRKCVPSVDENVRLLSGLSLCGSPDCCDHSCVSWTRKKPPAGCALARDRVPGFAPSTCARPCVRTWATSTARPAAPPRLSTMWQPMQLLCKKL
jgi:hypothetical protein